MSEYFGVNLEDIFNTMEERFRAEGAKDIKASFGYDIKGEGKWRLDVKDENMRIENTDNLSNCDATLVTDGETFVGINIGKIDRTEAYSSGKLRVEGDIKAFNITGKMFKKFIAGGEEADGEELIVLKRMISVDQRFATGPVMGKFLKALKDKKILAIKCPECGRLQSPPREVCAVCRVKNEEWVEIGPKGELRMFQYCYYSSPDPLTGEARETPYGTIGVLLDGCEDGEEAFWHFLHPEDLDRAHMGITIGSKETKGSRLRPVWEEKRSGSVEDIKYFEIDE